MRSAKAVKITDMNLLKRLGIIVTIFSVFLGIRTIVAPPVVIVGRTADDLKAYLCQTNWWDHSFTTRKYTCSFSIINTRVANKNTFINRKITDAKATSASPNKKIKIQFTSIVF